MIEAANSQPYSHIHQPGIAVGGHCIPVYPRLYLWNDPEATVVRAAREANAGMPDYTVGLLEGAYGDLDGRPVVVLGAAYRGGVKETAFSGVFAAVEALRERGAEVARARPAVHRRGARAARLHAVPPGRAGRTPPSSRPTTPSTATLGPRRPARASAPSSTAAGLSSPEAWDGVRTASSARQRPPVIRR